MSSNDERTADEALECELVAGLDLLDRLSTTDRMNARSAVNSLAGAIDGIRSEKSSIADEAPEAKSGPLLTNRVRTLEGLRIHLLLSVVFGDFEILDDPGDGGDRRAEDNIVVDGVALAHETLF